MHNQAVNILDRHQNKKYVGKYAGFSHWSNKETELDTLNYCLWQHLFYQHLPDAGVKICTSFSSYVFHSGSWYCCLHWHPEWYLQVIFQLLPNPHTQRVSNILPTLLFQKWLLICPLLSNSIATAPVQALIASHLDP